MDEDDEQKMCQHLAPEYKHLITIKAGKPKGALVDALKSDLDKVRRLSLSEQELAKVAARHGRNIVSVAAMAKTKELATRTQEKSATK